VRRYREQLYWKKRRSIHLARNPVHLLEGERPEQQRYQDIPASLSPDRLAVLSTFSSSSLLIAVIKTAVESIVLHVHMNSVDLEACDMR